MKGGSHMNRINNPFSFDMFKSDENVSKSKIVCGDNIIVALERGKMNVTSNSKHLVNLLNGTYSTIYGSDMQSISKKRGVFEEASFLCLTIKYT